MGKISETVRGTLGSEEEPFEGDVPIADVEKEICSIIDTAQKSGNRCKFVFDGFTHDTDEGFLKFIEQFGCPEWALFLTADAGTINSRWLAKNDPEGTEVPEDAQETIKADSVTNSARRQKLCVHFETFGERTSIKHMNTTTLSSIESVNKEINN